MREMRKILFRGKRKDNGEWVYGDLEHNVQGEEYIRCWHCGAYQAYKISPATRGQYTGLTDKNGVKIFEGDIISYNKSRKVVYFDTSLRIPCFTTGIGSGSSTASHPYKISSRHVVIGNIHDNPELLEGDGEG